jgi:aspartyl-tRNA synthetase
MVFVDLRDRYGITQITLDPQRVGDELMKLAQSVTHERVIQVTGEVVARPDEMINQDMDTGAVEIVASDLQILNTSKELPFMVADEPNTSEENRFVHRYIDLRRRPVLDNIIFRAKMNHFVRNWFTTEDFLEVQTPLFTVSSPEGARDYLIPSRVNPGNFYALPQAPQQYKQLLMVGGVDKYFQIAPCFRDEDPRADRHSCEFYQIDAEMSFVEQKDIFKVAESFTRAVVADLVPNKSITVDFAQLSHADAMNCYGSDKPDLRFGMEFVDLTDVFV